MHQIENPAEDGWPPLRVTELRRRVFRKKTLLPVFTVLMLAVLGGCASLPPGSDYPKVESHSLSDPDATALGRRFAGASHANADKSAFRIFNVGVDGFLMRLEMIDAAERSLDLEYYIFRGDESGRLLTNALVRAADRGVRVRVLVDDGETVPGDEQLLRISGHAAIEIRVFNPWAYRGHSPLRRDAEFVLRHSRLDYRMHNKMLIADGAVALVGGRNVGDQYFQIDPDSQFADDDLFAGGPIVHTLSTEFDEFWNSTLAIPAKALVPHKTPDPEAPRRVRNAAHAPKMVKAGLNHSEKLATGEPFAGILSGLSPLIWADAEPVYDSPDKKRVVTGTGAGSQLYEPVANAMRQAQSELLLITPYFIPTEDEVRLVEARRAQGVRVRILTNSLESAPDLAAHSGYKHYRVQLLREGVEFNEVRSLLGDTRGSGQSAQLSRYGNYALHAKLLVVDRKTLFIGSMNFDQRSQRLNTETGLIIHDPGLSQQTAARFEAMTRQENSYSVLLRPGEPRGSSRLIWRTIEGGTPVDYHSEPTRGSWQKFKVWLFSLLPLDSEL